MAIVTAMLVAFAGLPGTGKSTLSRQVARHLGATWLRVDEAEAGIVTTGFPQSFETGLAAYIVVRGFAAAQLDLGRTVVVDAVNGVEPGRAMWRSAASEFHASLFFVEVRCSDAKEHRRRVESRGVPTPPLSPPSWDAVLHCEYEPWTDPILMVDSTAPIDENVARILDYVATPNSAREDGSPTRASGSSASGSARGA